MEPEAEHMSASSEKTKNAWNCNCITFCVSMLIVDQPASGSEEGGSQLMQYTENLFILCFVCSQLDAEQGNTSP